MKLNLNDRVRFKFTPAGKKMAARCGSPMTPKEAELGECQLWVLMSTIGAHFAMGFDPFIERNEIEITPDWRELVCDRERLLAQVWD